MGKELEIGKGCGKRIVERKNGFELSYICRTEKMAVGEIQHLCPNCRKKLLKFKCKKCGYESDEPMDFIKSQDDEGFTCNDCVPEEKEFMKQEVLQKLIQDCQKENHVQQVVFSTYHNALTQVCFTCKKIRTSMKEDDYLTFQDK